MKVPINGLEVNRLMFLTPQLLPLKLMMGILAMVNVAPLALFIFQHLLEAEFSKEFFNLWLPECRYLDVSVHGGEYVGSGLAGGGSISTKPDEGALVKEVAEL